MHLRGSFNVARATIEHFREQNDGAYVLFTSTSGLIGNIGQANYGAAKMGIVGLSRIIAMEGAQQERALQRHRAGRLDADDAVDAGEGRSRAPRDARRWRRPIRADQPAQLSVALVLRRRAKDVSGQIFGARGDNIILYSQPRPIANLHQATKAGRRRASSPKPSRRCRTSSST